mmetsp:Transcript_20247/g.36717  ORF Transcript_20247/g.36717 Transcript_20247/m.36717 type:complete len:113 (-) Transcript_20247:603-941(-)|eukprot:CAMPEP_0198285858 /NCGR_PEP_ID=MMETSP1449-20131203/5103_1 /TAXON_ID=420275 /ORGANISM="Attheya septentrionalis, Strain CCMP2084" /LENGTH=112 /DNA_ID=CAMNT_0043983461 /DNA_START=54 /DNA_END=392 /DNA_ORIENTATION=-
MNAICIIASRRALLILPRAAAPVKQCRFMSGLQDEIKKKEAVEENLYIRKKEACEMELKRDAAEAKRAAEVAANPKTPEMIAIEEITGLLATTGDRVSTEGLSSLAKWKLGK